MKKTRFLIVEDELLIAETIVNFLKIEGYENVEMAETVEEAIACIEKSEIEFVLTDIALGQQQTGIDLGNKLFTKYKIPFIYITSHADKAMIDKAKHTRPNAYIIKPFKKEDLLVAIELALFNAANSTIKANDSEELIVKDGRAIVRLHHANILWLETEGNYTVIHLINEKRRIIRRALTEFEEELPKSNFIRIHKSYLINKKQVSEVRTNSIIINGLELNIGRSYQDNVKNIL